MASLWKTFVAGTVLCALCLAADIADDLCNNGPQVGDQTTLMQMNHAVRSGKDREDPETFCEPFSRNEKECQESGCDFKAHTFFADECVPSQKQLDEDNKKQSALVKAQKNKASLEALSGTQDGEADVEERTLWGTVKSEESMNLEAAKVEAESKRMTGSCVDGKPPKETTGKDANGSPTKVWRCDDFMSVNEVVSPLSAQGNDLFEGSDERVTVTVGADAGQLSHPRKYMGRTVVLHHLPLPLPPKEMFLLQYPKAAEISCSYELHEDPHPTKAGKAGKDKSGPVKALEGINGILECMQKHAQLIVDENVPLMKKRKAVLAKAEVVYKEAKNTYEEMREIESQEANQEYTLREKELKQTYQCGPQEEAIYFFKTASKDVANSLRKLFGFENKDAAKAETEAKAFMECLVNRKTEITAARKVYDARMKLFDNSQFATQKETWQAAKTIFKKQRDEVSGAEFQVKYLPKIRSLLGSSIVMDAASMIGDVFTTSQKVAGGISTVIGKAKEMEDALDEKLKGNKTGILKGLKDKLVPGGAVEAGKKALHNATIGQAVQAKDEVIAGITGAITEQTDQVNAMVDKVKNGKLSDLTGQIPLIGDLNLADFKSEDSMRFFVETKIKGGVNDALDTAWASLMGLFWTPIDAAIQIAQSALVSLLGSIPFVGGVLAAVVPPTIDIIYKLLKKMVNGAIGKIFTMLKEKVVMKFVNATIDTIFNHTIAKVFQAVEPHMKQINGVIDKAKEIHGKVEDVLTETKDMFQKVSDLATDGADAAGAATGLKAELEGASEIMGQKYALEDGDIEATDVDVLQDLQTRTNSRKNDAITDYYHFKHGTETCPRLGLDKSGKSTMSTYAIAREMECKMAAEILGFKYIKETDANCKPQFCATPTKGCHAQKQVCSPQDGPCYMTFQTKDKPGAASDETLTICSTPAIMYGEWGVATCPEGARPLNSLECDITVNAGRVTAMPKTTVFAKKASAKQQPVLSSIDPAFVKILPEGCLQRSISPEKFDGDLQVNFNKHSDAPKSSKPLSIGDKMKSLGILKEALLQEGEETISEFVPKDQWQKQISAMATDGVVQNARMICFKEDGEQATQHTQHRPTR